MTLTQLAAFMDQLKLPIEEAPRGKNHPKILAIFPCGTCCTVDVIHQDSISKKYCGFDDEGNTVFGFTHFLPLPKKGPVEFEVVPVGTKNSALRMAEIVRDGTAGIRGAELWSLASEAADREAAERSYLRGLETGAEVGRLEGEE